MRVYADNELLEYCGRIDFSDKSAPVFIYPCTCVKMKFKGTSIKVILRNKSQYWDNYMGAVLDGEQIRVKLSGEDEVKTYNIAENLSDTEHELLFFKRQDACHVVNFYGFELNEGAKVLQVTGKKRRRIEVYGDSVSAGEVSETVEYVGKEDPEHNGEKLVIGFVGGSITQGSLATQPHLCYAYHVYEWWKKTFPKAEFVYVNAGIGGTTSQFGAARVEADLLRYRPDFVITEFSVNDDSNAHFLETYEGLVRKIYQFETKPAPIAEVVVDGDCKNAVRLDANFDEDWGDKLELDTITEHMEAGKHKVEISIVEAHEDDAVPFYLVSVIAAEG